MPRLLTPTVAALVGVFAAAASAEAQAERRAARAEAAAVIEAAEVSAAPAGLAGPAAPAALAPAGGAFRLDGEGAEARGGAVRARVTAEGASFHPVLAPHAALRLAPFAAARESGALALAPAGAPLVDPDGRAVRDRGALREVFAARPGGIEILFEIDAPLGGAGDLVLTSAAATALAPRAAADSADLALVLDEPATGAAALTLGRVVAIDAAGERIEGALALEGGVLAIAIDGGWLDRAAYPVVIDPLVGAEVSVSAAGTTPDVSHSRTSDRLLAVWIEGGAVMGRRFESASIPLGAAFTIQAGPGNLTPSVAWLEQGDQFLVAYERANAIFARRVSAAGVVSAEIVVYDEVASFGDDASRPQVGGRLGTSGGRWIVVFDVLLGGFPARDVAFVLVDAAGARVTSTPLTGTGSDLNGAGGFLVIVTGTTDEERAPAVNELAAATQPWRVLWEGQVGGLSTDLDLYRRTIANDGTVGGASFFGLAGADTQMRIAGPGPDQAVCFLHTPSASTQTELWIGDFDTASSTTQLRFFTPAQVGTTTGFSDPFIAHANNSTIARGEYLFGWRIANSVTGGFGTALFGTRTSGQPGQVTTSFLELNGTTILLFDFDNSQTPGATGRVSQTAGRHVVAYHDLATNSIEMQQMGELPAAAVEFPAGTVLANGDRVEVGHFTRGGAPGSTQVTIRNTGLGDLRVTNAFFTFPSPGNPFTLAFAQVAPQGGTAPVTVTYDPIAIERSTAAIQVETEASSPLQLELTARAADAAAVIDPATPLAIPGGGATTAFTLTSALAGGVSSTIVHVDLVHANLAQLALEVEAPSGQRVQLVAAGALAGANLVGTSFADGGVAQAGGAAPYTATFAPSAPLSALAGGAAGGTWTLRIANSGAAGSLQGFSIDVVLGAPGLVVRDPQGVPLAPGGVVRLGQVALGTASGAGPQASVTAANPGTAPLTIAAATIDPAGDFTIPGGFTQTTIPGVTGQVAIPLELLAQTRGRRQATLLIDHDDPGVTDPFPVALRGIVADAVATTSLPLAIPDAGQVASTLAVLQSGALAAVRVHLAIAHPDTSDLEVALVSPAGTRVLLADRRGTGANLRDLTLDDAAAVAIAAGQSPFDGAFRPESALQALAGEPLAGTWTLEVRDLAAGDAGTLLGWALELDPLPPGQPGLAVSDALGQPLVPGASLFAGHAAAGAPRTVTFTVRNFGSGDLDLDLAALAAPFAIAPSGPLTVAAGGTAAIDVTFTPTARGAAQAQVSFTHNAPNAAATFAFAVAGLGADAAANIDPTAPLAVPDNAPAGVSAAMTSTKAGAVAAVRVSLEARHAATGDLALELVSPAGTRVPLITRRGGLGDDLRETRLSDAAGTAVAAGQPPFTGTFRPESPLGAFAGELAAGTWTLVAVDAAPGNTGALLGASLEIDAITGRALRVLETGGPAIANGGLLAFAPRVLFSGAASRSVTFQNNGTVPTTVQRATVTGGASAAFGLGGALASAPQALAPGGGAAGLEVRFEPRALGLQTETVDALHDAGNQGSPFRMVAAGRGVSGLFAPAQPVAIPDGSATGLSATASVPLTGLVDHVRVNVDVQHPNLTNLTIRLSSPLGTSVTLLQQPAGAGADLTGTTFEDGAPNFSTGASPHGGTFQPFSLLDNALAAQSIFGDWRLEVVDLVSGQSGALIGWSIELETVPLPTIALRTAVHPADAPVGAPFKTPAAVEAIDAQAQRVTIDATTRVTASIASGPAGAQLGGATTGTMQAGVAVFTTLTVDRPGDYVLRFSAVGLPDAFSVPFTAGATPGTGTASPGGSVARSTDGGGGGGGCQLAPAGAARDALAWLALAGLVGAARRRRRAALAGLARG